MQAWLTVNAGSSSLKCALFDPQGPCLARGKVSGLPDAAQLSWQVGNQPVCRQSLPEVAGPNWQSAALAALLHCLHSTGDWQISAIAHRVVHGGLRYAQAQWLDDACLDYLRSLESLAPLHQPYNLALIEQCAVQLPGRRQLACFDTAFHQQMPALAREYALPRALSEAGVLRYGFHGLSYAGLRSRLAELEPQRHLGRVVMAHLGSGASMCAMRNGVSQASSMGFSALDGLPMGTRCGQLDPGVLLYLMRERGMDADALEQLLYRESGWLGVSGLSSDMRTLRASSEPAARHAIDLLAYRLQRELGSLVGALGGLDLLVFSGGVGEHDAALRAQLCQASQWLGIRLDEQRNQAGAGLISHPESAVGVWVIASDEEAQMARELRQALAAG